MSRNVHKVTVESFGDEWSRFDQSAIAECEAAAIFDEYFSIFPWSDLPADASGFDMGCGTGRWAALVAPRVGHLHCVDPSIAIEVARRRLSFLGNVSYHRSSADDMPLPENSQDFGYSLGVLHHVPDTIAALRSCVSMLKPGAPLLVYLYYAFDNRSLAYRMAWRCSDLVRRFVYRLPAAPKHVVTDALALGIYLPLARSSMVLERLGVDVSNFPLSYYRNRSWYTMRTDSRDRFGTPLEKRFTKEQIRKMLESSGLGEIRFSEGAPYWCAVGVKR